MNPIRLSSTFLLVALVSASVACARDPEPVAASPTSTSATATSSAQANPAPAKPASEAEAASVAGASSGEQGAPAGTATDPFFSGFEPDGKWQVFVDGKASTGQVWLAQRAANAFLIDAPELASVVLVQPRQRSVETVARGSIVTEAEGTRALAADAKPAAAGGFEVVGEVVTIPVGGKAIELREAPYQLKLQSVEALLASNAHYRFGASRYRPSEPIIRTLRGISTPVTIKIFFGTWCPHCSEVLPKIFSIAKALEGSSVRFEFYGLDKGEAFGEDPEAKKYSLRGVPTGVVLVDGKERGRVEGGAWRIPELGIQNTLINADIE